MLPAKKEKPRQVARKKITPATAYIYNTVAGFCRKKCVWQVFAAGNVWVAGII